MSAIGGVPEHFNLPWELACSERDDLDWHAYPGGSGAMSRALECGELDVAVMLTTSTIRAVSKGASTRIVGTHVSSPLRWGIFVAAHSDITEVEQIQGRSFAISREGSGSHLIPLVDAKLRGWSTEAMTFVEVGTIAGARDALSEDRAEVFFWEQFMTQPLVDDGTFRRVGVRLPPWPSFVVVARERWLAENDPRPLLRRVNEHCAELAATSDTVARLSERFHLSEGHAREWLELTDWVCASTVRKDQLEAAREHLMGAFEVSMPSTSELVDPNFCELI